MLPWNKRVINWLIMKLLLKYLIFCCQWHRAVGIQPLMCATISHLMTDSPSGDVHWCLLMSISLLLCFDFLITSCFKTSLKICGHNCWTENGCSLILIKIYLLKVSTVSQIGTWYPAVLFYFYPYEGKANVLIGWFNNKTPSLLKAVSLYFMNKVLHPFLFFSGKCPCISLLVLW